MCSSSSTSARAGISTLAGALEGRKGEQGSKYWCWMRCLLWQAKQRARFFQLVDVFLSSRAVPAYTVAAFAKRFARLALMSSPAGLPFVAVLLETLISLLCHACL